MKLLFALLLVVPSLSAHASCESDLAGTLMQMITMPPINRLPAIDEKGRMTSELRAVFDYFNPGFIIHSNAKAVPTRIAPTSSVLHFDVVGDLENQPAGTRHTLLVLHAGEHNPVAVIQREISPSDNPLSHWPDQTYRIFPLPFLEKSSGPSELRRLVLELYGIPDPQRSLNGRTVEELTWFANGALRFNPQAPSRIESTGAKELARIDFSFMGSKKKSLILSEDNTGTRLITLDERGYSKAHMFSPAQKNEALNELVKSAAEIREDRLITDTQVSIDGREDVLVIGATREDDDSVGQALWVIDTPATQEMVRKRHAGRFEDEDVSLTKTAPVMIQTRNRAKIPALFDELLKHLLE